MSGMSPSTSRLSQGLLRTWLPRLPSSCAVCHAWQAADVCDACSSRFSTAAPRCPKCALPLPGAADPQAHRCDADPTATGHAPWPLDASYAAVDYVYPWRDLIAAFKYRGQLGLARWMGTHLHASLSDLAGVRDIIGQVDSVIPVPLPDARLTERGYNQAHELARHWYRCTQQAGWLAKGTTLERQVLVCLPPSGESRATPPGATDDLWSAPEPHTARGQHQVQRGRDARWQEMQGAFMVHPNRHDRVTGKRLLLIDDVMTTGATLCAAAHALKQAGAQHVSAIVFARALRDE